MSWEVAILLFKGRVGTYLHSKALKSNGLYISSLLVLRESSVFFIASVSVPVSQIPDNGKSETGSRTLPPHD